jgi:hypothetical protein
LTGFLARWFSDFTKITPEAAKLSLRRTAQVRRDVPWLRPMTSSFFNDPLIFEEPENICASQKRKEGSKDCLCRLLSGKEELYSILIDQLWIAR